MLTVIYDKKNKKAITEPSNSMALTKIFARLKETGGDRYELRHVEDVKPSMQQGKHRE